MLATFVDQSQVLKTEMEAFLRDVENRHRSNFWFGRLLVLLGIGLATASVILGLDNQAKTALVLAALAGGVAAIESAFAIRDVGEYQRIIASETRNLVSPLKVGSLAEGDLPKVQEAFYALRKNFDQSLPKGTGMEAVKKLMDDLDKAKRP